MTTGADKKLTTDDLNYSRDIYARTQKDYPQVKEALEFFHQDLLTKCRIGKRYAHKYRDHLRIFLIDLLVADVINPGMYLTYSRNANDYGSKGRYSRIYLKYGITLKIVQYLEDNGYIEHHPGKKNVRLPRIRAKDELTKALLDKFKIDVGTYCWEYDESMPTVILRKKRKRKKDPYEEMEFPITDEIRRIQENVKTINRNMERHAVFLYLPDDGYKKLAIRMKNKGMPDFSRKWSRRIYNDGSLKFDKGGRFYGGAWQNLPSEYRVYIRLNDKDVVECDYSGLHINMLYARDKIPLPKRDVYYIPGYSNDHIFREFVKKLQLSVINADSPEAARKGLFNEVTNKGLILPKEEVPSLSQKHIFKLIDDFKQRHKPISKYFCTCVGKELQNIDARISEKVLLHFSKIGYPILPMHDSFIIHHGFEHELTDVMNQTFNEKFSGTDIKIEPKYRSIEVRQKEDPSCHGVCELSITEILQKESEYSIYHKLLDQFREHRRRKKKKLIKIREMNYKYYTFSYNQR